MPTTVVSTTLAGPPEWPDATLVEPVFEGAADFDLEVIESRDARRSGSRNSSTGPRCTQGETGRNAAVPVPTGPLPNSILLWHADELRDPPRAPCCLRATRAGSRAVVYRTGPDSGVAALVDFVADAVKRPHGGWAAEAVVRLLARPLPRGALLDDEVLGPVFRHLRGRRRLPEAAALRLARLLSDGCR